jgi:hypothetical protein
MDDTTQFKATALDDTQLRAQAPSIFAPGPMRGVSPKYTFVPTVRLVEGLRAHDWLPVGVEEQRSRTEARRGFQKHLIRFRRADQMATLEEWNLELVVINSHDAGCAYQLHAGLYRRICSNGLVIADGSLEGLRFRHAGLEAETVVAASFRLIDQLPRIGAQVQRFRERQLTPAETRSFAEQALLLRYPQVLAAPIAPETLLTVRRPEDAGDDLWRVTNRLQLCGAPHN